MNLKIKQAGRKLIAVSLKFSSENIGSGAIYSIYEKSHKVIGKYPRINKVENILYYDFKDPKQLEKVKAFFEQMIEVYGEKKKPSQGGNPKKAKENNTTFQV